MGNAFTCYERGHWDSHPGAKEPYKYPTKVYQDMSQPLSHYFINAGHNSYLTGNQLNSDCGTAVIIKCLHQGCRVIELDVYNKQKGYNGPVCKHGGTMTKPVLFEDCVRAVREHAFETSPYPVILTLENHTDFENQGEMASTLRRVLGAMLFEPSAEGVGQQQEWRSPEELRGRVIMRGQFKAGKPCNEALKALYYIPITKFNASSSMGGKEQRTLPPVSSSINEDLVPKVPQLATLGALEAVGAMVAGLPDRIVAQYEAAAKRKAQADGSDGEEAVESPGAAPPEIQLQAMLSYTMRHLLRVYPAGWRVGSWNYDPVPAWNLGASIVALNWQNWDKPLWINQGKFADNGGCGYVLKPPWMLDPSTTDLPPRRPRRLRLSVYSAFHPQGGNVMCFKDDIFVQAEVKGLPCDCTKHQTKTVQNSGRLVADEDFVFDVSHPELAVLLLQLKDEDLPGRGLDDCVGYFSLPLACLVPGEYKVGLKDHKNRPLAHTWVKVKLGWMDEGEGESNNKLYAQQQ